MLQTALPFAVAGDRLLTVLVKAALCAHESAREPNKNTQAVSVNSEVALMFHMLHRIVC